MKINKKFVNLLAKTNFITIGEIIKSMEFLEMENNGIQNLNTEYKTLEQVFFTVKFLEDAKLVTDEGNVGHNIIPDFNPSVLELNKYLHYRLGYIQDQLKRHWQKKIRITPKFYSFIDNGYKTDEQIKDARSYWLPIGLAIGTALLAQYLQFSYDAYKNRNNSLKAEEIVSAELSGYLNITNEYILSKNQIVSDNDFAAFIQRYRYNIEPLKELLATNFMYFKNSDLAHLAVIRERLTSINKKLDILEQSKLNRSPLWKNPECNFMYFSPEDKQFAHRYLSDDYNNVIFHMKSLSFFKGNPYKNLEPVFDITPTQVSVFYFVYNPEYKDVDFNCK
jgi:hypothetical protein